jgi:hypothetical protein
MEPFIRAMEVWAPTHDGAELELGSGSYAELYALRDASTKKRFAFGAGLPGKVWESRRPLAMRTDEPHFQRSAVARSSAISHAIGLPIFSSQYLIGVVVLLCGSSAASVGAIELWHCDTTNSYDMKLVDGHFGTLEHFETVARRTSFRPGTGLPGEVWQQRLPVVMHGLGRTHRFVRFDDAREAGLTMGFGVPLFHDPEQAHVLMLLSALGTPIPRRLLRRRHKPHSGARKSPHLVRERRARSRVAHRSARRRERRAHCGNSEGPKLARGLARHRRGQGQSVGRRVRVNRVSHFPDEALNSLPEPYRGARTVDGG